MGSRATGMSRRWDVAQMGCRADGMSRIWKVAQRMWTQSRGETKSQETSKPTITPQNEFSMSVNVSWIKPLSKRKTPSNERKTPSNERKTLSNQRKNLSEKKILSTRAKFLRGWIKSRPRFASYKHTGNTQRLDVGKLFAMWRRSL